MDRRHLKTLTLSSCVALLLLGSWWWGRDRGPDEPVRNDEPPAEQVTLVSQPSNRPIAVPDDEFVSSSVCLECHADQYHSWHDSFHRRMTQVASTDSVIGDFSVGEVSAYGKRFRLEQRDSTFWVNMPDPDGDAASRVDREIVLTTGSHHMQIYWYATDKSRSLAQLPVAWLRETQQWVPTSALFIAPPGQPWKEGGGRWNDVCIKCHTTHGQPRVQENLETFDTLVAEFGISCEACHGPARAHVARHQNREPTRDASDVVHPGSVDHRTSAQLCGQCHGSWLEDSEEAIAEYRQHGRPFRAGDDLAKAGHLFHVETSSSAFIEEFLSERPHYLEDRFWGDGMPRVSGTEYNSLARSACFQEGTMTCISCHVMHHDAATDSRQRAQWANDQLGPQMQGNQACVQCHTDYENQPTLTAHTHHAADSEGSQCYNCHMPHTTYGLLKAIRSHEISSPDASATVATKRPNACNLCHVDKTLAWTGDYLQRWYQIEPPKELTRDQQTHASMLLDGLQGHAGQRALAAWSIGWKPAHQASRVDWAPPVLAQLLMDPYDAVRHIAHRSLRTLQGYEDFAFNYVGTPEERSQAAARVFHIWAADRDRGRPRGADRAILIDEHGGMLRDEFTRLFRNRDDREVLLAE